MTVSLGTLWSFIKEVNAPFVFDGEHEIALHVIQGYRASSRGEEEVSLFFSSCDGNGGYILEVGRGGLSIILFVHRCQDSHLVAWDTSEFSLRIGRATGTPLDVRREPKGPFPFATGILGLLSIFKRSQASSPFEAWNSPCLSRCQSDVRPPIEMSRGTMALSIVSTGNSDIPSTCEMKDEPAFKALQGNLGFFPVRASPCPFHWRQQTQGPSHIPIAERSLLLRCLWKGGIPLESKPGYRLSSRDDMCCTELSSSCCAELGVPLDLGRCSRVIYGVA